MDSRSRKKDGMRCGGATVWVAARHALEAMATPGEASPAPPWSRPLLTSNQPWAQKRNAATTANPTQSGQWVRPMQTIQLRPSLTAPVPLVPIPGANRDNSASPQCFSAPCYKRPVPGRSAKKGGSPAPAGSDGLAQVPPGQQEPSFPWKLSPHQRGAGTAGGKPVACRESLPWRAVDGAGLRSQVVGMVCTMAASARAGPFPVGGYAPLAASASASLGATGPSLCRAALACGSSRACPPLCQAERHHHRGCPPWRVLPSLASCTCPAAPHHPGPRASWLGDGHALVFAKAGTVQWGTRDEMGGVFQFFLAE